jgi:protein SCO1/2
VFIAFLYTNCEDVCPLIAKSLDSAVQSLGHQASSVSVVAVSVDPNGDTPDAVRRYVRRQRLGPEFHYLSGTHAQLAPVWQAYNVLVEGRPADKVVHSAPVFLLDRRGRPRLFYSDKLTSSPAAFVHDLHALLGT